MSNKTGPVNTLVNKAARGVLTTAELKGKQKRLLALREEAIQLESEMLDSLIDQSMCEERYTEMFNLLVEISNTTKSRAIRRKCLTLIKSSEDKIVDRVTKKYREQGINACIAVSEKKVRQAKELKAEVTAITGELYISEFEKLKQLV